MGVGGEGTSKSVFTLDLPSAILILRIFRQIGLSHIHQKWTFITQSLKLICISIIVQMDMFVDWFVPTTYQNQSLPLVI